MGSKKKQTKTQDSQKKQQWNDTELKLASGALTLAVAFGLSQITGITHEHFYGSFQRFISGFFILMAIYLVVYLILYKKYSAS
ncbi:hypothetical protein [Anoxynatronum buryatiense]|uniref:Uncharacterized protein n=1 Tax=Anoxynatronum buryatiense TaxID=489973 RepID=A0AA45WYB8_9CLOT|nr:hypothetical protein [Anoxynatronum buryatiense]SMP68258.1 hypothetical protein SAMN06296020_11676 [Anoxynatronum buryatiense]